MTYPQLYERISAPWRSFENGAALLSWIDKGLVGIIAAGYGVTLVWLLANNDARWIRVAAVPAAVLVLVSIVRTLINAPRPYEAFDIEPLVPTSSTGHSLPSRHVTSAFIIAYALGFVDTTWGIIACLAACLVAYTRVAAGVHFPRDVVAGALFALVCGFIGFNVL